MRRLGTAWSWLATWCASDDLVANVHVIGDDRTAFVADRFDFGDGKTAAAQLVWEGLLQGVVQIVFEGRGLFGWREDAGVHAIGVDACGIGGNREVLDFAGTGGEAGLRLLLEPGHR